MIHKADKTLILIRCVSYNNRIKEIIEQLERELPGYQIAAAPDQVMHGKVGLLENVSDFPITTLPLTDDFIADNGLQFHRNRTGWICGDYVLYRALELKWERLWLIEPDIYFLNNSLQTLAHLDKFNHGLITTQYRRAGDGWYWKKPLLRAAPNADVHAMAFGIMRLSRTLVEQAFDFRKELSQVADPAYLLPNDESVVATTAHVHGHDVIDFKALFPQLFKYWHTNIKFPIFELREFETEPRIVHSGLEKEDFEKYLIEAWGGLEKGTTAGKNRLLASLKNSSPSTVQQFLELITSDRIS